MKDGLFIEAAQAIAELAVRQAFISRPSGAKSVTVISALDAELASHLRCDRVVVIEVPMPTDGVPAATCTCGPGEACRECPCEDEDCDECSPEDYGSPASFVGLEDRCVLPHLTIPPGSTITIQVPRD